jgi:hypothetical protein
MAKEASTSKIFERRESSRELNLEILRNRDRVAIDRDGTARVVGGITGSCAVKFAIKDKRFDGLSSCSRSQQCNGQKFEGSRKHVGEDCRFGMMNDILTPTVRGFISTLFPPGMA